MNNDNGFITIISLLIMSIILISAIFLNYTCRLEYQIANSSKNSAQSYYLAESKIYLSLYKDEYYNEQLLPRVERYAKLGRLKPTYDYKIRLNENDLFKDDTNNIVSINFLGKDEKTKFMLSTQSSYNGITNKIDAEVSMYNDLFSMGIPIVTSNTIIEDKIDQFNNYMSYLKNHIKIPELEEEITDILALDYEEIKIVKYTDNNIYAEFYRNGNENPIYKEPLCNDKVFMILKYNNLYPSISIMTENDTDKIALEGILYVEGDLNIYSNFEFSGILIVNGEISVHPTARANINGIILCNNFNEELQEHEGFKVNYDFSYIKRYGIYLPKFIDLKIQKIKVI